MLLSPLHHLRAAVAMAVAFAGLCCAAEPDAPAEEEKSAKIPAQFAPISCSQFEKLFPDAIKYPAQAYYTLKINGSSVVCFYDQYDHVALAIVLTQATRNAVKLAEILHMQYETQHTDREKLYHKAILFNKYILFRDCVPLISDKIHNLTDSEIEEQNKLPFTTLGIMAGMYYRTNNKANHFKFVSWNRQGITFSLGEDSTSTLILSTHLAQSPIVHKFGSGIKMRDIYPPYEAFVKRSDIPPKTLRRALKLSKLDEIYRMNEQTKVVYGTTGMNNVGVLGIPNRKYTLDKIPQSSPKDFPTQRSEWPTPKQIAQICPPEPPMEEQTHTASEEPPKTDTPQEETSSTATTTQDTPQKPPSPAPPPHTREVNIPLTPQKALNTYLLHLQKLSR